MIRIRISFQPSLEAPYAVELENYPQNRFAPKINVGIEFSDFENQFIMYHIGKNHHLPPPSLIDAISRGWVLTLKIYKYRVEKTSYVLL